jgi:prevent-host-death family protein
MVMAKRRPEWQLQEANAMFSEVIKLAVLKPQLITVRGKKTAVILSYEEYEDLTAPKQSLFELIQNSPFYGVELELPERGFISKREVNL